MKWNEGKFLFYMGFVLRGEGVWAGVEDDIMYIG